MKVKTTYRATVHLNSREVEQLMLFIGRLSLGLKLREFVESEFRDMAEAVNVLMTLRKQIMLADNPDERAKNIELNA
jgi:hypothetical protein